MIIKETKEMTELERMVARNSNAMYLLSTLQGHGFIYDYVGDTPPEGFALCNGQAISKTEYPELFAVIGYTFGGSGDNYNLPDLRQRVTAGLDEDDEQFDTLGNKLGEKTVALTGEQNGEHKHEWKGYLSTTGIAHGSEYQIPVYGDQIPSYSDGKGPQTSGEGLPHNNIQPTFVCHKIIRIANLPHVSSGDFVSHPYISLERLRSYLYKVTFENIPEENETEFPVGGGCSSYVADGKLYRNLDWGYTEAPTFKVVCKGFEGNAFSNELTDSSLDDDIIGQLPYHMVDGKNDYNIMVSEHVLYNDWEWQGTGDIPLTKLPYLILSQIKTLNNFETQIAEILSNVKSTPALDNAEYLLQFLVTDGTTSYAIMPPTSSSGAYVVQNITANPKLTNFRWVSSATVDRADLQERPTGVERWNAMPCSLADLRFTKAYEQPTRLSEFIGINGTSKDSTDEELTAIYNIAHGKYESRTRNGETWQTMHSVIYSSSGMEILNVQENFKENYGNQTPQNHEVDQTYDPESENAQSGIAVAEALANKLDTSKVKNSQSTTAGDVYDVRHVNKMSEILSKGVKVLNGDFKNGGLTNGTFVSSIKYRVSTPEIIHTDSDILLNIESEYRIGIHKFVDGIFISDSGWVTGTYLIASGSDFKIVIARTTDNYIEIADIDTFVSAVTYDTQLKKETNAYKELVNLFERKHYFSHIGVGEEREERIVIPVQSKWDVQRAKRLGFEVIELNVHKLSDGNYICAHGTGGKFNGQFTKSDRTSANDIVISNCTLQWIKENIRFSSKYPKYRVAPFSLQEMLTECCRWKITPLVQYVDDAEIDILDKYMGKNRYILSIYNLNRGQIRNGEIAAPLTSWLTNNTAESLLGKAQTSGLPYICVINASDTAYSDWTVEQFRELATTVHQYGFQIGFSSAYTSRALTRTLWEAGFDISGSDLEINEIEHGNILNLDAGVDFTDFSHEGTVTDGILSLTIGSHIRVPNQGDLPMAFLGGGSLHIRFSGSLHIGFGYNEADYVSDGTEDVWISSYIQEDRPSFIITANTDTEVYDLTFKASNFSNDSDYTTKQQTRGKLDASKVKNALSTTAGDVYDVRYINSKISEINTNFNNVIEAVDNALSEVTNDE